MGDTVVAIIVIIILIVAAIVNAKKKNSSADPQNTPPPVYGDDPWDTIRRYMEGDTPVTAPEEEPHYNDGGVLPARKEEYFENKKYETYDGGSIPVMSPSAGSAFKLEYEPDVEMQAAFMLDDGNSRPGNTVLSDFNVRDAVLYSEILKPKFKE